MLFRSEPMKIWGRVEDGLIVNATAPNITAQCLRVPVSNGHMAAVFASFEQPVDLEKIKDMEKPTLVSGTDGVGTKIKLAFLMDKHDTIGIDCVAMCVNDIACAGGEPLFFLDYIACGKNIPEKIAEIVKGVSAGCVQSEAALIGGETAEHPGLMPEDEYDLAGFAVGVVDEKDLITGENLKPGDVLIDNNLYGQYAGEVQIARKPMKNYGKTNVVGHIDPREVELLPYMKGSTPFGFNF